MNLQYKGMKSEESDSSTAPNSPNSPTPPQTQPISEDDIASAFVPDTTAVSSSDPTDLSLDKDDRKFTSMPSRGVAAEPLAKRPSQKRSKKPLLVLLIILALVSLGAVGYLVYSNRTTDTNTTSSATETSAPPTTSKKDAAPATKASPLSGMQVDPALADRKVTAIMIENSYDARPQSGLVEADMVYEAIAEGGITRFLALYQESSPQKIGPVRSARPYYVEWASIYHASYVHAGGSEDGLSRISELGVDDVNAFQYEGSVLYRSPERAAPHDLYTGMPALDGIIQNQPKKAFTPLDRKLDVPQTPVASTISLSISSALFNSAYIYDPTTNTYARSEGGEAHVDEKGTQIKPKVVIALETTRGQNEIYSVYKTVGSGAIKVFQDGIVSDGTWERSDLTSQYVFKDKNGLSMKLNAGQTWVTLVESLSSVSYTP